VAFEGRGGPSLVGRRRRWNEIYVRKNRTASKRQVKCRQRGGMYVCDVVRYGSICETSTKADPARTRYQSTMSKDIKGGKNSKESALDRILETLKQVVAGNPPPLGSGVRRRRTRRQKKKSMAFILEGSHECTKSELGLSYVLTTQTSLESGMFVEYWPISSLTDGAPIELNIMASGDNYINCANSLLHVKVKLNELIKTLCKMLIKLDLFITCFTVCFQSRS